MPRNKRPSFGAGAKVFSVKFRYGLDQKRMKLGIFPRITLATAREKAMDILRQADEGMTRPSASAPLT